MFSTTPTMRWRVCRAIAAGSLGHLGGRDLRRGHDDDLGSRHQLGHRDRDVAGAGRQVEQQDVQVTPVDVGEELLQRPVQHRPAPHDGRVALGEHARSRSASRRGRSAAGSSTRPGSAARRCRASAGWSGRRCRRRPHRRDRPRAAIAAARFTVTLDLPTPPLPDATAYTRVSEPGCANGITGSAASPRSMLAQLGALLVAHHVEGDGDGSGTRHVGDRLGHPLGDLGLLRARRRGQVDLDVHRAVVGDRDALDHVELGDRAAEFRVDHFGQCGADRALELCGHHRRV